MQIIAQLSLIPVRAQHQMLQTTEWLQEIQAYFEIDCHLHWMNISILKSNRNT